MFITEEQFSAIWSLYQALLQQDEDPAAYDAAAARAARVDVAKLVDTATAVRSMHFAVPASWAAKWWHAPADDEGVRWEARCSLLAACREIGLVQGFRLV